MHTHPYTYMYIYIYTFFEFIFQVSSNPGSIKFLPLRKAKKLGGKVFTKDQNAQFVKMEKTILEEIRNLKAE